MTKMNTTANKYRNPWARRLNVPKPEYYENDAPAVASHHGVTIYKLHDRSYDFVYEGTCITQRAGIANHRAVIDGLFSGKECCCPDVAAHLRAHGHNPMTYGEYVKLWSNGKVA